MPTPTEQLAPPSSRPPVPLDRPRLAPRVLAPASGLGFFLFLLVNVALFVRPADVVPSLIGIEIYQYLILACFAVSFPVVLVSLSPQRLEQRPIDVCVL